MGAGGDKLSNASHAPGQRVDPFPMRDSSWYGRAAMSFWHNKSLVVLAVLTSLSCGGTTPSADSPAGSGMSAADARAFVAEAQAERGATPPAPVTSMEQFLEVLDGDQIPRFESASAFVAGKPGIDALMTAVSGK